MTRADVVKSRKRWRESFAWVKQVAHVQQQEDGQWSCTLADGTTVKAATEESARQQALDVFKAKHRPRAFFGANAFGPPERPRLVLCDPCNHKAAELGALAEIEGVELCEPCAVVFDEWERANADWRRRWLRNRAKAARQKARA
jgi:hypothetical protein